MDKGAIIAAYVGIGMGVTIAVSFLLIIPIEWVVWILTIPAGLLIGYYANQRSDRRAGPWSRILVNGVDAAFITGLTIAALRVQPVVVTLAMYFALQGVDLLLAPNPVSMGEKGHWIYHLAGRVGPIPGALFTIT